MVLILGWLAFLKQTMLVCNLWSPSNSLNFGVVLFLGCTICLKAGVHCLFFFYYYFCHMGPAGSLAKVQILIILTFNCYVMISVGYYYHSGQGLTWLIAPLFLWTLDQIGSMVSWSEPQRGILSVIQLLSPPSPPRDSGCNYSLLPFIF